MTLAEYCRIVILPILAFSVILILVRFFKGPSIADRIVALDLLITTGIGIIGVYTITSGSSTLLDTGMILALIAFLSTTALSYYLERRSKKK